MYPRKNTFHICLPYCYDAKVNVISFLHILQYNAILWVGPLQKESIRHEVYVLHHAHKVLYLTSTHEFRPVTFSWLPTQKGLLLRKEFALKTSDLSALFCIFPKHIYLKKSQMNIL